jgi:hypothetical protein
MQLFFALVILCLCARCLECGIQGQLRECGYGAEGCYDLDMRVRLDPKRPPRPEPQGRDSYEAWPPNNYERWQLGSSGAPISQQRKRPRGPWHAYNNR